MPVFAGVETGLPWGGATLGGVQDGSFTCSPPAAKLTVATKEPHIKDDLIVKGVCFALEQLVVASEQVRNENI